MSLITTVIVLIVAGFFLWWIKGVEKIDGTIKKIIIVVVLAAVILYLLYGFGILPADIKIPKVR